MDAKSLSISSAWKKRVDKLKSVGIDAMCFIYQFEAHPVFGSLSNYLFNLLEERKLRGFTSIITLAEILSLKKLQQNRLAWEEEKQRFYQTPSVTVENVDGKICEAAALLRGKYNLYLPDAIQLTTSLFNRADAFITNDERLRKVKELSVIVMKDFVYA